MRKAKLYIAHDDGGFVDIGELLLADGYDIYKSPKNDIPIADDKPHFDFSRRPDSEKFVTDACNAQSKNVLDRVNSNWHELGELPPVGTECEYYRCEHNDWKSCRIEFIGRRFVVMSGTNGSEFCRKIAKLKFRPLKTERERAIEEMQESLKNKGYGTSEYVLGILYDAGFRKEGIGIEFGKFEDNHYWARHWSDGKMFRESGEKSGFQDKLAAARRAIVRAAAEIGKSMQ